MQRIANLLPWALPCLLLLACSRKPAPAPAAPVGDLAPAQRKLEEPGAQGAAKAAPEKAAAEDGAADPPGGDEKVHELKGVKLAFRTDGSVRLVGQDRWGAAIDTRYENRDYLRNALPTLSLSLPEGAVEEIQKLVGKPDKRAKTPKEPKEPKEAKDRKERRHRRAPR